MSVITLQYGQCGNQISQALYSSIYSNLNHGWDLERCLKWFDVDKHNRWEPRSVLIDTEGKTTSFLKAAPYKFKNIVAKSYGGSANNWAFAYADRSRLLMGEIVETVRREVEKCDLVSSFLNVFGSSGGTGSGIGSAVLEYLHEEYPNKTLVNAVILPYSSGEIVIQSYNSILTLCKIYNISDCSIIFENDRLHYICSNNLDIKNVSFGDINNLIAQQLCSVYQPVKNLYMPHMLGGLCTHPLYKLLNVRSSPLLNEDKSCNWKYNYSSIQRQSRFDYQQQTNNGSKLKLKNLVSSLISRGAHVPSAQDLREYKDPNLYAGWLPDCERAQTYHDVRPFQKLENHLTLISNSNSICTSLSIILKDAWNLFRYGAYLHHYKQFGIDEDYFIDSFEQFQIILDNYKSL